MSLRVPVDKLWYGEALLDTQYTGPTGGSVYVDVTGGPTARHLVDVVDRVALPRNPVLETAASGDAAALLWTAAKMLLQVQAEAVDITNAS